MEPQTKTEQKPGAPWESDVFNASSPIVNALVNQEEK
jgi:hypothetical protein